MNGPPFPDSALFTESGRDLLVSMNLVVADPLRVEAERWLRAAPRQTAVTRAVREALGDPYPAWMQRDAAAFQSYDVASGKGAFRR